MAATDEMTVPAVVFGVVRGLDRESKGTGFAYTTMMERVRQTWQGDRDILPQQERWNLEAAVLAYWNDLIRTGVIAFGTSTGWTTDAFRLSETGRATLQHFDRDPSNPEGYMAYLQKRATLNPVSESYVREALNTYRAGCHKAAAVMIGTAAEGMILSLRDVLLGKLEVAEKKSAKGLGDWRIKVVCDALAAELEKWQKLMPTALVDRYNIYWPGFTAHIRAIRNASGHPNNIDPVTPETVRAALLNFHEFASLAIDLEKWAQGQAF